MAAAEQLITANLDVWSSTVKAKSSAGRGKSNKLELYGIDKLRELILEFAVRGLLVPQDLNDEPASELLKKIATEKAQLVKDGKIRKRKKLPEISADDELFQLPKNWEYARLNDLGDWGAGATPSRRSPEFYGGNILWFKSGELVGDYISESEETVTELALEKTSLRYNSKGDVLIAMYGATIGKASILGVPATTNQAVCACTPFPGFANTFLLTLLKAYKSRFIGMGAGGAQPNISREKIIATVVAVPPTSEQHCIVAKVDELMALCDQLAQQQETSITAHQTLVQTLLDALTTASERNGFTTAWARIADHFDTLFTTEWSIDQLKQTILQLAVMGKLVPQDPSGEPASELLKKISREKGKLVKHGKIKKVRALPPIEEGEKPFKLPQGWEWCRLQDLITVMDAGWSPACPAVPSPSDDIWGVLKTTAVQTLEYRQEENKVLADGKEPRPQYEVKAGDILITRAGPKNRVGISCLVQKTRPKLMISDKIIRFHLAEIGIYERYISLCLNAGATARYLESAKSGMAESQMNISQDKLKAAPIPLAPLNEQRIIVETIDILIARFDALKARINTAQTTQLQLADAVASETVACRP